MQVPPDAVEPLFKQIVNHFVHDRSRPEVRNSELLSISSFLFTFIWVFNCFDFHQAIAVGLNVIREICLRMPLVTTSHVNLIPEFYFIWSTKYCPVLLSLFFADNGLLSSITLSL